MPLAVSQNLKRLRCFFLSRLLHQRHQLLTAYPRAKKMSYYLLESPFISFREATADQKIGEDTSPFLPAHRTVYRSRYSASLLDAVEVNLVRGRKQRASSAERAASSKKPRQERETSEQRVGSEDECGIELGRGTSTSSSSQHVPGSVGGIDIEKEGEGEATEDSEDDGEVEDLSRASPSTNNVIRFLARLMGVPLEGGGVRFAAEEGVRRSRSRNHLDTLVAYLVTDLVRETSPSRNELLCQRDLARVIVAGGHMGAMLATVAVWEPRIWSSMSKTPFVEFLAGREVAKKLGSRMHRLLNRREQSCLAKLRRLFLSLLLDLDDACSSLSLSNDEASLDMALLMALYQKKGSEAPAPGSVEWVDSATEPYANRAFEHRFHGDRRQVVILTSKEAHQEARKVSEAIAALSTPSPLFSPDRGSAALPSIPLFHCAKTKASAANFRANPAYPMYC